MEKIINDFKNFVKNINDSNRIAILHHVSAGSKIRKQDLKQFKRNIINYLKSKNK